MPKNRLEAFSDGVFSIAITLLVLELRIPNDGTGLGQALANHWPSYATYAVSFLVIGIIWVNHHVLFGYIARTDRPLLFLNLLMLMSVAVVPFPTSLLGEYLGKGSDARVAAGVYGGVMTVMALSFNLIWGYARSHDLFSESVTLGLARATTRIFRISLILYATTVAVAAINAYAALIFHAVLALFYVFDPVKASSSSSSEASVAAGAPAAVSGEHEPPE